MLIISGKNIFSSLLCARPTNMVASLTGTVKMQDFITAGIVLKSITSEVILIRTYTFIHGVTGLFPQGWPLWTASSALG